MHTEKLFLSIPFNEYHVRFSSSNRTGCCNNSYFAQNDCNNWISFSFSFAVVMVKCVYDYFHEEGSVLATFRPCFMCFFLTPFRILSRLWIISISRAHFALVQLVLTSYRKNTHNNVTGERYMSNKCIAIITMIREVHTNYHSRLRLRLFYNVVHNASVLPFGGFFFFNYWLQTKTKWKSLEFSNRSHWHY